MSKNGIMLCHLCIGHHVLNTQHIRSHQHMNNIKKLPMEYGKEWWTMSTEELYDYLNKNSIDKYNDGFKKKRKRTA